MSAISFYLGYIRGIGKLSTDMSPTMIKRPWNYSEISFAGEINQKVANKFTSVRKKNKIQEFLVKDTSITACDQVDLAFITVSTESSSVDGGTWKKLDLRCAVNLAFHLSRRTRIRAEDRLMDGPWYVYAGVSTPHDKVVYPSSFNYLINSISSIIFAHVIKPPTKVNNLWRTFNSRSSR